MNEAFLSCLLDAAKARRNRPYPRPERPRKASRKAWGIQRILSCAAANYGALMSMMILRGPASPIAPLYRMLLAVFKVKISRVPPPSIGSAV